MKTIILEAERERIKCHVFLMAEEEIKGPGHVYGSKLSTLGTDPVLEPEMGGPRDLWPGERGEGEGEERGREGERGEGEKKRREEERSGSPWRRQREDLHSFVTEAGCM